MKLITFAWRNIGRNRRRSALSAVAIAVAALSIVMLFSLLEGMKADMANNLITFYTGEVRVRHPEYGQWEHLSPLHLAVDNAAERLAAVENAPGVAAAVPRLAVGGAVFNEDQRTGVQVVGVDFAREAAYSNLAAYVVAGDLGAIRGAAEVSPSADSAPVGPRTAPAVVGSRVPERLGVALGDQVTVVVRTAERGTNAMTFTVSAIADFPVQSLNQFAIWAPLERVQRLARMPDAAGELLARTTERTTAATVAATLSSALPDMEVRNWQSIETTYGLIEMASRVYNVIALVFFLLASTVIVNTTMMVIFERRREIGTLGAMGMRSGELIRLFFVESLMISTIGAAVGTVAGIGITAVLGATGIDFTEAMAGVDMEISSVLYPVLNIRSTLLVFVFAVAVSGLTTWLPTRRISRIAPAVALREE